MEVIVIDSSSSSDEEEEQSIQLQPSNVKDYLFLKHSQRERPTGFRDGHKKQLQFAESLFVRRNFQEMDFDIGRSAGTAFATAFSPDGLTLAVAHGDKNIRIFDVRTRKLVTVLTGHSKMPWTICFHSSLNTLLASGCSREVRVWDIVNGRSEKVVVEAPIGAEGMCIVTSVCFHPTETYVAFACGNSVYLWDWSVNELIAQLTTRHDWEIVKYVRFDPTGTRLLTAVKVRSDNTRSSFDSVVTGEDRETRLRARYEELLARYETLRQRYRTLFNFAMSDLRAESLEATAEANSRPPTVTPAAVDEELLLAPSAALSDSRSSLLQPQERRYGSQMRDSNMQRDSALAGSSQPERNPGSEELGEDNRLEGLAETIGSDTVMDGSLPTNTDSSISTSQESSPGLTGLRRSRSHHSYRSLVSCLQRVRLTLIQLRCELQTIRQSSEREAGRTGQDRRGTLLDRHRIQMAALYARHSGTSLTLAINELANEMDNVFAGETFHFGLSLRRRIPDQVPVAGEPQASASFQTPEREGSTSAASGNEDDSQAPSTSGSSWLADLEIRDGAGAAAGSSANTSVLEDRLLAVVRSFLKCLSWVLRAYILQRTEDSVERRQGVVDLITSLRSLVVQFLECEDLNLTRQEENPLRSFLPRLDQLITEASRLVHPPAARNGDSDDYRILQGPVASLRYHIALTNTIPDLPVEIGEEPNSSRALERDAGFFGRLEALTERLRSTAYADRVVRDMAPADGRSSGLIDILPPAVGRRQRVDPAAPGPSESRVSGRQEAGEELDTLRGLLVDGGEGVVDQPSTLSRRVSDLVDQPLGSVGNVTGRNSENRLSGELGDDLENELRRHEHDFEELRAQADSLARARFFHPTESAEVPGEPRSSAQVRAGRSLRNLRERIRARNESTSDEFTEQLAFARDLRLRLRQELDTRGSESSSEALSRRQDGPSAQPAPRFVGNEARPAGVGSFHWFGRTRNVLEGRQASRERYARVQLLRRGEQSELEGEVYRDRAARNQSGEDEGRPTRERPEEPEVDFPPRRLVNHDAVFFAEPHLIVQGPFLAQNLHHHMTTVQGTFRIQCWDFSSTLPDLGNAEENVVVPACKIYSDSWIDVSSDWDLLVAIGPTPNRLIDVSVGIYSLDRATLGQLLWMTPLSQFTTSVSLSPSGRHLVVGVGKCRLMRFRGNKQIVAKVYSLDPGEKSEEGGENSAVPLSHVRDIERPYDVNAPWSVSNVKWCPHAAHGLVVCTNKGEVKLLY